MRRGCTASGTGDMEITSTLKPGSADLSMLPESNRVIWRLNYKQMGLEGDNSWGAMPLEQYQIPSNETYEYTYTLKPVSTNDMDASMAESKVVLPE